MAGLCATRLDRLHGLELLQRSYVRVGKKMSHLVLERKRVFPVLSMDMYTYIF